MELQEVMLKRQSARKYKEGDVPDEALIRMIELAGKAPSGKNAQNWHFAVVKNQALKDELCAAIAAKNEEISAEMDKKDEEKAARFRKFAKHFTLFIANAPALVVVYTRTYFPSGYPELEFIDGDKDLMNDILYLRSPGMQSLGAAIENFTLAAVDMGYGSCWLTSANYAAREMENVMKEKAGFELEGYFIGALLAVGIPVDELKSPVKKPVEEIYTFFK